MKCKNCNNPLNEWQDKCECCGAEVSEVCACHGKPVKRVKGSCLGQYDYVCEVSGHYCKILR